MLIDTASGRQLLSTSVDGLRCDSTREYRSPAGTVARWMDVHGDAIHATSAAIRAYSGPQSPGGDRIQCFFVAVA
jgi:hypothetical protein